MKKIAVTIAAFAIAISAFAQDFETGYFLKSYSHVYRLNPALRPEKSFVSLPVIGGASMTVGGNIGLDNILYPLDNGKLGTFMHPEITTDRALSGLKSSNKMTFSGNINLLSLGFKKGRAFHSIDASVRTMNDGNLPYELFSFMKRGLENSRLDIPDVKFGSNVFLEVAYGLSLQVSEGLTVGARVKYLAGLENSWLKAKNLSVAEADGYWSVSGDAELSMALNGAEIEYREAPGEPSDIIDDIDVDDMKLFAGHGLAVDLGFDYEVNPSFRISASITDLGGISWKNDIVGKTTGGTWEYNPDSDEPLEDLANLLELHAVKPSDEFRTLNATARIGAEWNLNKSLSLGVLGKHRFGMVSLSELRGSANLKLLGFLSLSGSVAVNDFGVCYGGAVLLDCKALTLFVGMDSVPTKVTPQYIPVSSGTVAMSGGLNITF